MQLNEQYQTHNPFRSPEWRWERVLRMCDRHPTPGRPTKRDDEYVKKARRFLLLWRDKDDDDEREELFWEEPGLFYAYKLNEQFHGNDQTPAMITQARLLAGQDYELIAKGLCTIPETIDWYEKLFFNIGDRLDRRDWITAHVLLPAIMRNRARTREGADIVTGGLMGMLRQDISIAQPFLDASLKFFAYFGGPYMVDIMITGFQAGKKLESVEHLAAWFDSHVSMTIRRRCAQAAMQFEVNKYNVMDLFAVHNAIMALEKSTDNIESQQSTTERHIQGMLEAIPWALGADGEAVVAGTKLGEFDQLGAELRDDEVLKLSAGDDVELEDLTPLRIPPPRKKAPTLESLSFSPAEKKPK